MAGAGVFGSPGGSIENGDASAGASEDSSPGHTSQESGPGHPGDPRNGDTTEFRGHLRAGQSFCSMSSRDDVKNDP